jgi:hypothetical protein
VKKLSKAALISLALVFMFSQVAQAASNAVDRTIELISTMESSDDYGSVANDSNGSPSVGILQWNNTRAIDLIKKIVADDPGSAKSILGGPLYEELKESASDVWSEKALDATQRKALSALMKSDSGVRLQKEQAHLDVANYINRARSLGIVDANALVYYADIAHQAGVGGVRKYAAKAAEATGSYEKITLKSMYDAALEISTSFKTRRKRVYDSLRRSPVKDEGTAPEFVKISPSGAQSINLEGTKLLTALLSPVDAVTNITWSSSDPKIASVNGGIITPKKIGTVTITAKTSSGLTDRIELSVTPVYVERVSVTGEAQMKLWEKQTLKAECLPENAANKAVKWRSLNPRVALVASNGVVLARAKGEATVYCITQDGSKKIGKIVIHVE